MRLIKVGLTFCGESFGAVMIVPEKYWNPDGLSYNERLLRNRLSGNAGVSLGEEITGPDKEAIVRSIRKRG